MHQEDRLIIRIVIGTVLAGTGVMVLPQIYIHGYHRTVLSILGVLAFAIVGPWLWAFYVKYLNLIVELFRSDT